jgi:hypothetical protein
MVAGWPMLLRRTCVESNLNLKISLGEDAVGVGVGAGSSSLSFLHAPKAMTAESSSMNFNDLMWIDFYAEARY